MASSPLRNDRKGVIQVLYQYLACLLIKVKIDINSVVVWLPLNREPLGYGSFKR